MVDRSKAGNVWVNTGLTCFFVKTEFPSSLLIACSGKKIFDVVDHPVTRDNFGAETVIKSAYYNSNADVSVFRVRRAV